MKSLLLIITLLISWNAVAVEKTWFCTPEYNAGLSYEDDSQSWSVANFAIDRMIIKQTGTKLEFADDGLFVSLNRNNNCYETTVIDETIISCSSSTQMFNLNPKIGLATSSGIFGWLHSKHNDTPVVVLWKCESF